MQSLESSYTPSYFYHAVTRVLLYPFLLLSCSHEGPLIQCLKQTVAHSLNSIWLSGERPQIVCGRLKISMVISKRHFLWANWSCEWVLSTAYIPTYFYRAVTVSSYTPSYFYHAVTVSSYTPTYFYHVVTVSSYTPSYFYHAVTVSSYTPSYFYHAVIVSSYTPTYFYHAVTVSSYTPTYFYHAVTVSSYTPSYFYHAVTVSSYTPTYFYHAVSFYTKDINLSFTNEIKQQFH